MAIITNATTGSWSSTPDVDLMLQTQYRVYDGLLALGLCFCFLIGLPGNCLSLTYFALSKKRSLPNLLYITACCIDICSCMIHLPVAANLLNNRDPGLLGNEIFCAIWYSSLVFVQMMSMFVVMVISVTRTIVIIFPFYRIRKITVFMTILLAFIYINFWISLYISHGVYYYSKGFSHCEFDYGPRPSSISRLYFLNYSVWSCLIPIVVFMAMMVAIFDLKISNQITSSQINRRKVSITIICFSAVFLVCNFLTFLNVALHTYSNFLGKSYIHFYKSTFMFFYSWQLSDIFCIAVNATLNPILYICRFKEMRALLSGILRQSTA